MHHVAGVHILQLLILDGLQVEFATIERRDRRRALNGIGLGTGRQRSDDDKYVYYLVHTSTLVWWRKNTKIYGGRKINLRILKQMRELL